MARLPGVGQFRRSARPAATRLQRRPGESVTTFHSLAQIPALSQESLTWAAGSPRRGLWEGPAHTQTRTRPQTLPPRALAGRQVAHSRLSQLRNGDLVRTKRAQRSRRGGQGGQGHEHPAEEPGCSAAPSPRAPTASRASLRVPCKLGAAFPRRAQLRPTTAERIPNPQRGASSENCQEFRAHWAHPQCWP